MPQFGKRVVGEQEYAKAVRNEKGGAAVFGVRVRGAIPQDGPTNTAKRVTEHGPRVTSNATFQDANGKEVDAVAIDDLKDILAENPTTFDSLFEAELAREDGARPEALEVFLEVERGIKGAMRADVIDDIQRLLDQKQPLSALQADNANLRMRLQEEQSKRQEQNALLVDAPTIKAIRDRQENLDAIKKAGGSDVVDAFTTEGQMAALRGDEGTEKHQPTTPAKPEGHTRPETQQPGERPLTPKRSRKRRQ